MEIWSGVGIGPIRFGMGPDEVRRTLGVPYDRFWKGPTSEAPTDAFDKILVHVHYDASLRCEAVEVAAPGVATFRGEELLCRPLGMVVAWLRLLDPTLEVDPAGFISLELGLGAYAPGHDEEPDIPVEAVIAFRVGYYERAPW